MVATPATPTIKTYRPGEGQANRGACIYGRSGVGKSTMLGTVPGNGLLIEVPQLEGSGSDVLADHAGRITVTPVASWDETEQVYEYLEAGNHPYKWAAIDTITDIVILARRKIIKDRPLTAAPHKLTLPERGEINTLVEDFIYKFRSLPIFTFWVAQERRFDNDDGADYFGPAVPPGVLTPLVSSMMLTVRLKLEYDLSGNVERHLMMAPTPGSYTKVRTRPGIKIPSATRTLDFTKIMSYLAGKPGVELDVVDSGTEMEVTFEGD